MNSTGSGTLTVMFSEVGFTPSAGSVFQTNVGGTTTSTGSLLFSSYADSANTLFGMGTGTQIGSFLHTGNGSFSGNDSTALTPPGSYALTTKAVIDHDSAGRTTSFDMHVNVVPEPGSLFLLGSGILGLAVLRRKS